MYSMYYTPFLLLELHFMVRNYLGTEYSLWSTVILVCSTVIKRKSKQFQGSDIVKMAK